MDIAKLRELMLANRRAGGIMDQYEGREFVQQNSPEEMQSRATGLLGLTPVVGDAMSAYEGVQAARQGDWMGAGLGALGALPFVPAMGGAIKYHGSRSSAPFDVFNTKSNSINSTTLGDVETVRHGAFVSDKPAFAEQFGEVSKWDVKPKKTAVINDDLKARFLDTLSPFDERDLWLQAKYSREPWGMFEGDLGERFSQWLKYQGFDSAKFKEYTSNKVGKEIGGTTTVILDPSIARRIKN
jgi:hypothetical protein